MRKTSLVLSCDASLCSLFWTIGSSKCRSISCKHRLKLEFKWALCEEKHFRRLIEDVTDLVTNLVDLFPAAQSSQQELCKLEVQELGTEESLPILNSVAYLAKFRNLRSYFKLNKHPHYLILNLAKYLVNRLFT